MAGVLQHLRSSTLDKRPNPASMVDGQIAINYASGAPGMFFKDSNGSLVKVGPVHVGSGAPNAVPASGGTAGNSIGEQWLDTSGGTYVFKIWDGAAWRSEAGEFVNVTGDTMTGDLVMNNANLVFEGSVDDGFETTLTVVNPTADRTITLPNVTGTVVTTGDSGTVTSTMIADGTIVNADVNASAAIAGTKISPNFGSQTIQTTGIISAAGGSAAAPSIAFTGDTNTGIYSPGADQVAISTNGAQRLLIDSSGNVNIDSNTLYVDATNNRVGLGTSSPGAPTHIVATGGSTSSINVALIVDYEATAAEQTGAGTAILFRGKSAGGNIANHDQAQIATNNTGSNNAHGLSFYYRKDANDGILREAFRYDAQGRVGIGVTGPGESLHVNGNIRMSAVPGTNTNAALPVLFQASTGTIDGGSSLTFNPANDALSVNGFNISSTLLSATGNIATLTCTNGSGQYDFRATNDSLRFISGSSEAARFDGSQRLLVGTSSAPQSYDGASLTGLQIEKSGSTATRSLALVSNASSNFPAQLHFGRSRGTTNGAVTAVANGDDLGVITFGGADGTTAFIAAANIIAEVDGTPGANDMPGRLVFSTTADGASSPTERMRIKANGVTCIGTSTEGTMSGDTVVAIGPNIGIISKSATGIATSGTVDISINTGGGGYQGFLVVSNTNTGAAGSRTHTTFSVFGRGTDSSIQQIATDNGPTSAASFTVTTPTNGVIRVTNTSAGSTTVYIQFFGGTSL